MKKNYKSLFLFFLFLIASVSLLRGIYNADMHSNDFNYSPAVMAWATWCIACKVEHPFLMKLKEESIVTVYGLNYKDNRRKALDLLKKDGNPFELSIFDEYGKLAIDLGVYGAPETFFIDKKGIIRERHVGVLTTKVWKEKFERFLNEDNDV